MGASLLTLTSPQCPCVYMYLCHPYILSTTALSDIIYKPWFWGRNCTLDRRYSWWFLKPLPAISWDRRCWRSPGCTQTTSGIHSFSPTAPPTSAPTRTSVERLGENEREELLLVRDGALNGTCGSIYFRVVYLYLGVKDALHECHQFSIQFTYSEIFCFTIRVFHQNTVCIGKHS